MVRVRVVVQAVSRHIATTVVIISLNFMTTSEIIAYADASLYEKIERVVGYFEEQVRVCEY